MMKATSPLLAAILFLASVEIAPCGVLQMPSSQKKELRRMRYGLTPAQVVAMEPEEFDKYWASRTPGQTARSVSEVPRAVYTLAMRDLNDVARARLPAAEARRLKSLDLKIRFLGVLFARNRWTYNPSQEFDAESDDVAFASVERDLLLRRYPLPTSMADKAYQQYRANVKSERNGRKWTGDDPLPTLAKMDRTWKEANALVRGVGERRILHDFMLGQIGG